MDEKKVYHDQPPSYQEVIRAETNIGTQILKPSAPTRTDINEQTTLVRTSPDSLENSSSCKLTKPQKIIVT